VLQDILSSAFDLCSCPAYLPAKLGPRHRRVQQTEPGAYRQTCKRPQKQSRNIRPHAWYPPFAAADGRRSPVLWRDP
jgi:hypothetical protein